MQVHLRGVPEAMAATDSAGETIRGEELALLTDFAESQRVTGRAAGARRPMVSRRTLMAPGAVAVALVPV